MLAAFPLAYLMMDHWLNDYVYRNTITPLPFVQAFMLLTVVRHR